MPLTRLLEHLAQTKQEIATGERDIARQRSVVANLRREGQDTAEAERLLARFEAMQAGHVATVESIRRELAANIRGES